MKMASDYWKRRGMSLGLTWGLNLKLGDAPPKGSVKTLIPGYVAVLIKENTSTLPLNFFKGILL